ncbi:zinc finger protein 711-like [Lycorma delicatula]|uniref:zinc finger protein 711-like n=1 Tax=Lycorma delicatula TaxID=130591 RepID=UPI003F511FA9
MFSDDFSAFSEHSSNSLMENNIQDVKYSVGQNYNRRFQCPNCLKTYMKKYCLKRHMTFECVVDRKFKCPYCDYHSKRKEYLKSHITAKHETWEEPRFSCPYCDHKSRQKCNLKSHIICKHIDIVKKNRNVFFLVKKIGFWDELCLEPSIFSPSTADDFKCDKCNKSYKFKRSLTRHIRFECGVAPQFQCSFAIVNDDIINSGENKTLVRHRTDYFDSADILEIPNVLKGTLGFPGDNKPFYCSKCNRSYKARASLYRHIKFECGVEPQFQCSVCGFRFKQKCDLKKHFQERHVEGNKVFGCTCYTEVNRQQIWNERQFACHQCNRSYKRRSHLNQHLKFECGVAAQFQCPYCQFISKRFENLKCHIFTRHSDQPFQPFKCPHCSHRSSDKISLKKHIFVEHLITL